MVLPYNNYSAAELATTEREEDVLGDKLVAVEDPVVGTEDPPICEDDDPAVCEDREKIIVHGKFYSVFATL